MNLSINLQYKANEIKTHSCVIDKIIEVENDEFFELCQNLNNEYAFIKENTDWMKTDDSNTNHCLLVMCKDIGDGILIHSAGYDYARYSAYIPHVCQMLFMEERYNCIQDLESFLTDAVDDVLSLVNNHEGNDPYRVIVDELLEKHGLEKRYIPLLLEMLGEHSGLDFEVIDDEIFLHTNHNRELKQHRHLYEDEIKIICAKHVLWNHEQPGGERADFSNVDLSDCDFTNADLNGAIFKGSVLNGTVLSNGSFTFCDFTNAELNGVDAVSAVFEESNFTGAKLINCHFFNAHFTHSNFTGADLNVSDFSHAVLNNSDFTGAKTENANLDNAWLSNCTELPEQEENVEMTMM